MASEVIVSQLGICLESVPALNAPHSAPGHLLDGLFLDALAQPGISSVIGRKIMSSLLAQLHHQIHTASHLGQ